MAGNSFGSLFRITTAGESHGPANLVIIDGVPAGLALDVSDLEVDLGRRRPGQSRITSQRNEADVPVILSGVFEGQTTGTSIAISIPNLDQRPQDYDDLKEVYRPGHADFGFQSRYQHRDYRGGGRSSARETVARVAAGAVAKKLLSALANIRIVGWVQQIGHICMPPTEPRHITQEAVEHSPVRCPDPDIAAEMIALIEQVRREGDSIGGMARIAALEVPPGLGDPVFDKLKADLGKAFFSLPAVVGVSYGAGFDAVQSRGSQNNDPFIPGPGSAIHTKGNRHGGILGGISSGMPIVFDCAIKPTSSIPREQQTVNTEGEATVLKVRGRHDPCLLPRFIPMGEAMMAITLADHLLRFRAARMIEGGYHDGYLQGYSDGALDQDDDLDLHPDSDD